MKLEIIRLVEENHLSARRTLAKLGIPRATFYRWYDRYLQRGEAGLQDQSPRPKHVWNRVPTEVKRKVVDLVLTETELSPRELAVTFTTKSRRRSERRLCGMQTQNPGPLLDVGFGPSMAGRTSQSSDMLRSI